MTITADLAGAAPGTWNIVANSAGGYSATPAGPLTVVAPFTLLRAPSISGSVRVGRTVLAAVGAWSPKADSYRYEWRLNGKVIKGATAAKLKIKSSWAGKELTVVVIAKRAGQSDGRATNGGITIKR
jgi:hypothetical protein